MSDLQNLLLQYRNASVTEREKGTYFEELILTYFRYEATFADLYSEVWLYADWAKEQDLDGRDTGIDLVAKTRGTDEFHAIQCKFYAEDYRVRKSDIDSFFTASGQKPFTHRIIVSTTTLWTENAELALVDQQPPVTKIDLKDLENSQIVWAKYKPSEPPVLKEKKTLRKHQISAHKSVLSGLKSADRGKLIMACGTGKTFTSLKIAEDLAGKGKRVLFLVPSLNLLSQTLTEWTQESDIPLHSFAVCSDSEVGKKKKRNEDTVETFAHELRYPATTDAKRLATEMAKRHDSHHMSVVFSTYHSIDVISRAQHLHGLDAFDLIVCDEAHRTTGATFENESESNFVKVHDAEFIRSAKRLYMTATPRIYAPMAKATAERDSVALCSMDDEALFGQQLHVITFSEAVQLDLLCDYKVIVLTIDHMHVSERLQALLADDDNQLKVDDAARIIGCWKALSKLEIKGEIEDKDSPMRRAVAFCQVIEAQKGARTHKVSSKQIASMFQAVVEAYNEKETKLDNPLICEADHVDGSMNAAEKESKLSWLKDESPANTCRILSNVRCLSEGVDVPSLDAVLFLTPRSSQVDVVQSVGRVMRKDPAGKKKKGYVILPVVIPSGMDPAEALNDNKVYKVVWEVLQALRSHDDKFDAMINKMELIGSDPKKMEVIAITDKIQQKSQALTAKQKKQGKASGQYSIGEAHDSEMGEQHQAELQFNVGELERALYAKIVKKCGNRNYWDEWAKDIAKIANTHITRITAIVNDPENFTEATAFKNFADELRDDLNDSITDAEVIEMLAQHLITKPVFDALFEDYSFASNNPVSLAMQGVLDALNEHRLDKEADTLEKFYASVKMRADGIDNAAGKQKIVVELYDKFFRNAFPRMTERLGIVYTPVEVVDFIIHSINDLLQQEFGQSLGSEGVHIIDPFTGTGTFITRLLQSGLISKEQLPHKYKNEIHANEIVLLAYYIAAINIEAVYHGVVGGDYTPFEGICLTDTFQLYEKDDLISSLLIDNSDRRKRQKALDIRVIMGNPPYNSGATSEGDGTGTIDYPDLDERINKTYKKHSNSRSTKDLDNSYIRAIKWGSDRLGTSGVLGYVSGNGWVDKAFADGMRHCLATEFDKIYVFNLRGDIRKNMFSKGAAGEGENIFEGGCMNGISIAFFIKNPKHSGSCEIRYYDIGDNLTANKKREVISNLSSTRGISDLKRWQKITPDTKNDWINQRDLSFELNPILGDKRDPSNPALFSNYSLGINTNRDSWSYNSSRAALSVNMSKMIDFYNSEVERYSKNTDQDPSKFVSNDLSKIKWSSSLTPKLSKFIKGDFYDAAMIKSMYRPFQTQWLYYDKMFIHRMGQFPSIFPGNSLPNVVICVTGVGARRGFSTFISNIIPDLHTLDTGQCFPLYLYEKADDNSSDNDPLFATSNDTPIENGYRRKDGISDAGLAHFQAAYPKSGNQISKEDLFYYIYGLLHSPEYRNRYADNLSKELPRIPAVKQFDDFMAYSKAGRELAHWHLNYETVDKYPAKLDTGKNQIKTLTPEDYRVTKMKFPKVKDPETKKSVPDKTRVIYNQKITATGIPLEAYDYVVNGKPAIEWVMERQAVTKDKKSGITNDANLWATETMGNAKYPLELLLRVITVSLETNKVLAALPKLEID